MIVALCLGQREWQLAYRVTLGILKSPDQAEDAAQEALLKAFTARERFAGRAGPDSWLYRIAHNAAVTHLRNPFAKRCVSTDAYEAMDARTSNNAIHAAKQRAFRARRAVRNHIADIGLAP